MKKLLIRSCLLLGTGLFFANWGYQGHQKINYASTSFFPKEMAPFKQWCDQLKTHAADADKRKSDDHSEGKKHYIDIDNYSDFIKNHKIVQDFDSATARYGADFVQKNGTLPWSIVATYHSLVEEMKAKNWEHAILTAADLGHYVGDSFMPLHITGDYDGQNSGQKGVHARYESTMIDKYINFIKYDSSAISQIRNVQSFVFSYLYQNYAYKDSVLKADSLAFEQAGKNYSDAYYEALWKYTGKFTTKLFRNASQTFAELIYTAWIEAGKPEFKVETGVHIAIN
jgi:hypothetical protein